MQEPHIDSSCALIITSESVCFQNKSKVLPVLFFSFIGYILDELWLKKLPTVRSLQEEYATLLAQKKADHAEYYKLEKENRDLLIYKANTERLLNLDREETKNREHQREEK